MALLETATTYILALLTEHETIKSFPQAFIAESAKWVKSWFLKEGVKTFESTFLILKLDILRGEFTAH